MWRHYRLRIIIEMNFIRRFSFAVVIFCLVSVKGQSFHEDDSKIKQKRSPIKSTDDCSCSSKETPNKPGEDCSYEISSLTDEKQKLNDHVSDLNSKITLLENEHVKLKQRIEELRKKETNSKEEVKDDNEKINRDGTKDIFDASEKGFIIGVKYWYAQDPTSIHKKNGNDHNYTPLYYASYNGHLDIVNFLLSKEVDVDAVDSFNATPLIWACRNSHMPVVKALLDKGAKINKQDRDQKWTPMHWAVWAKDLAILKFLIEKGADKDIKDKWNNTPLGMAKDWGDRSSIVDYLSSL